MRYILFSCFIFWTFSVSGQKPNPKRPFEITLSINDIIEKDDNRRINKRTNRPVGIYGINEVAFGSTPEEIAKNYLHNHAEEFGLSKTNIDTDLRVTFNRNGLSGNVVRLSQYYRDIPVYKSEIIIHLNNQNEVTYVASSFKYGLEGISIIPVIDKLIARDRTVKAIDLKGDSRNEENELVIFSHNGHHYLTWFVQFSSHSPSGDWESFVDALGGQIIQLRDLRFYHKSVSSAYSIQGVRWHPPMSEAVLLATGDGNIYDPDPLSSAQVAYGTTGFVDNADVASTELNGQLTNVTLNDITQSGPTFSLVGPWAEIQEIEAPNKGTFSQNSSTFNFNRSDDAFEAVNVYYHIDASMRYLNVTLGLNIRPTSYAGGVRFDPHGFNGADQSYYSGGSNEYLVFGEGCVDDGEDSDVIHHELGHGLHDWVTNGSLSQVDGLSEGSGDYWAVSYNRSLGNWASTDPAYFFVFNWDGHNPCWGGRTVNYKPATPPYPGGLVNQVHTDGQIWSTCMMEVWDKIGKTACDIIFWEGLGMTISTSSQDDAANAVYQAAIDLNYTIAQLIDIHTTLTNCGYSLPSLPQVPTANFTSPSSSICIDDGGQATLIDVSTGVPTSWIWSFPGGIPAVSTDQNPTVIYSSPGEYSVTLISTNSLGSDTVMIDSFITVLASAFCPDCQTYASTDIPQSIRNNRVAISNITVTTTGVIVDVNVLSLIGTHSHLGDIDFVLVNPIGTQVEIISPQCTNTQNFNLSLDDDAANGTLPCPYNSGATFIPSNPLSAFNGDSAQGDWELRITDNARRDNGELTSWSLEICIESDAALPVELIEFNALSNGGQTDLYWSTASEINNKGFEIQRKHPGSSTFVKIGFVEGQVKTTQKTGYTFSDKDLFINGEYSYRLMQIDYSGETTYSEIKKVKVSGLDEVLQVYPNPTHEVLHIFNLGQKKAIYSIYNIHGQLLYTHEKNGMDQNIIHVDFLEAGVYYLRIDKNDGSIVAKKFIVD